MDPALHKSFQSERERKKRVLSTIFRRRFGRAEGNSKEENVSVKGSQMQLFTSGEEFFHWAAHTPVPNSRCVFYAGTNFASAAECLYT